jgi:aspartate 1-decarboxylase
VGDVIIIMSFALLPLDEAKALVPKVINLEPGSNRIRR